MKKYISGGFVTLLILSCLGFAAYNQLAIDKLILRGSPSVSITSTSYIDSAITYRDSINSLRLGIGSSSQNLDGVLTNGHTSTNSINLLGSSSVLEASFGGNYSLISSGQISSSDGTNQIYLDPTNLVYQYGAFSTGLSFTHPTSNNTVTFRDMNGTVAYTSDLTTVPTLQSVTNAGSTCTNSISLSGSNYFLVGTSTSGSGIQSGGFSSVNGSTSCSFTSTGVGYALGSNYVNLNFSNPTAGRNILFPDASGTVSLTSSQNYMGSTTLSGLSIGVSTSAIFSISPSTASFVIVQSKDKNNPIIASSVTGSSVTCYFAASTATSIPVTYEFH